MDKKEARSVTRKGISGKSKTKDEVVEDSKVKELPLKDEIGRKVGRFVKFKRGEKSAVKKSEAGGRIEITKGKINYKKTVAEESEIKNFETPMKRKRGADGEIVQAFLLFVDKGSSRLRPRKEVPEFKMVELADEDSERIIGKRVKVYWSGSRKWFSGCVKAFDYKKMLHTIYYEDGDKEDLNLSRERFQLEVMPGENFTLKLEPKSEKKVKDLYDDMVIAEFLKNNSGEDGNSELKKDSEPMKKEAPKNALRRGSSKPKRIDAEVSKAGDLVIEMDVDVISEGVDESKPDKIQDVEGGETDHIGSKSLLDRSRLESNSETWDMGSEGGEGSEKLVKGSSVKKDDAQSQKKHVKLNKKAAPTRRAEKLMHSKTKFKEESKEGKLPAIVEFDGDQDEAKTDRMHLKTNLEESLDLSFLKEKDQAKSPTRESSPENGGMSQEAEASQSTLNGDENELGLDGSKLSRVASDGRITSPHSGKYIMEGQAACVEVDVHPIKVDEKVEGGEIKVEGTMAVNLLENNDGEVTLSQAVSEGTCKKSLNLQPIEPESVGEEPKILQGKLKIINSESARDVPKEALEGAFEGTMQASTQGPKHPADNQNENHTTVSALAIQKIFVRRTRTKVEIR